MAGNILIYWFLSSGSFDVHEFTVFVKTFMFMYGCSTDFGVEKFTCTTLYNIIIHTFILSTFSDLWVIFLFLPSFLEVHLANFFDT